MPREDFYRYVDPRDADNELSVHTDDGKLWIEVAEEKAVDSYNSTFTCSIGLDKKEAVRLRDYLIEKYPLGN